MPASPVRFRTLAASERLNVGDWATESDRHAAAQQAERQRIADYYARQTRQQEERENAQARERFLAQQQN